MCQALGVVFQLDLSHVTHKFTRKPADLTKCSVQGRKKIALKLGHHRLSIFGDRGSLLSSPA